MSIINNTAVANCVHDAAKAFHSRKAKLGSVEQYSDPLYPITCTLFGFNESRQNQIIEVKMKNVVIDKLIISKLSMKHKCNFAHVFRVKTSARGM